jgi:protocatechuate 3,4-dioxygenase beta subunit
MPGPFYPLNRSADEDADLTRIAGRTGQASGTIIDLIGQVLDVRGGIVPNAMIRMWQANSMGRYHHPKDPGGAPIDPGFQGAAILRTNQAGRYRVRTVIPGPYAGRLRHIHFDVRGRKQRLVTQMFFPGEPNERDFLYRSLRSHALQAAVTAKSARRRLEAGVPTFIWDIVFAGESSS